MVAWSGNSHVVCGQSELGAFWLVARKWWRGAAQLALLVLISASRATAQAAAEYGGTVAAIGAGGVRAVPSKMEFGISQQGKKDSAHLPMPSGDDAEAANRKALEARAGKDAAKLTLRSTPGNARVRIDGRPVGRTPLVLVVPPGEYNIEMEGTGTELTRKQVSLLPNETREVALVLQTRYPARVQLAWPAR